MEKVYYYTKPKDVSKSTVQNYFINLYDCKGKFVEARRYKGVSGSAMMDIAYSLRQQGFKTEW